MTSNANSHQGQGSASQRLAADGWPKLDWAQVLLSPPTTVRVSFRIYWQPEEHRCSYWLELADATSEELLAAWSRPYEDFCDPHMVLEMFNSYLEGAWTYLAIPEHQWNLTDRDHF